VLLDEVRHHDVLLHDVRGLDVLHAEVRGVTMFLDEVRKRYVGSGKLIHENNSPKTRRSPI
jgi:hypothetical protein